MGLTADGYTSDVEVIDIENPTRPCDTPNFPYSAVGATAIVGLICGGHNDTHYSSECYMIDEKGTWVQQRGLNNKRYLAAFDPSNSTKLARNMKPLELYTA